MNPIDAKVRAILNLRPNAVWTMHELVLEWIDEKQSCPTEQEIDVEIIAVKLEFERNKYKHLRAQAYPDYRDYLDGIVKGDAAQVQKYIADCLAVKARFPK